ncbi:MAG: hypothetical protein Ta2G_11010 [Termitinemataceae bacterium]|nr:MAG: hypothetical protein Ta2G_11010 [Termitinemataceae bacterium]
MGMRLYGDRQQALAGQTFGLDSQTETFVAGENMDMGVPCFGMTGESEVCYGAHVNAVKLTASAALVDGNIATVTVNGKAVGSIPFTNDSPSTIRAIKDAIELNEDVRDLGIDAFLVEGLPLAIFLSGPGITITASIVVSGGASQATFSSSAYTDAKFLGVSRHEDISYREGVGFYPKTTSVSVQTWGKIYAQIASTANPADKKPAYVILTGADAGKFTDASSGNYDCGCIFRSDIIDGNLALVELRGLK